MAGVNQPETLGYNMHWNHRVVKSKCSVTGDNWYEIVEAYYDKKKMIGHTQAMAVCGADLPEIRSTLVRMLKATYQPVAKSMEKIK
jgi:hypothetical protein